MPQRKSRSKPASRTCSVRACSIVANSNRNPSLLPNDSGSEAAVPQQLCFSCCASDGFASAALPQLLCLSCFASAALPQLLCLGCLCLRRLCLKSPSAAPPPDVRRGSAAPFSSEFTLGYAPGTAFGP